jgi:hypothetical protein
LNTPDLIYQCASQEDALDQMESFIKEHPNFEQVKEVKQEIANHKPIYKQLELFT